MAYIMIGYKEGKKQFQGISTDTKPTLAASESGSSFYCVDNGDYLLWHIDEWVKQ